MRTEEELAVIFDEFRAAAVRELGQPIDLQEFKEILLKMRKERLEDFVTNRLGYFRNGDFFNFYDYVYDFSEKKIDLSEHPDVKKVNGGKKKNA